MEILQLAAQMQFPKWRSDSTVSLTQITAKEISPEQMGAISAYAGVSGFILFKPNQFVAADIPAFEASERGEGKMTRAQRIKAKLYKVHMQSGGTPDDFQSYYECTMNEFEQLIDDKLN